jgi:hypothetical protein
MSDCSCAGNLERNEQVPDRMPALVSREGSIHSARSALRLASAAARKARRRLRESRAESYRVLVGCACQLGSPVGARAGATVAMASRPARFAFRSSAARRNDPANPTGGNLGWQPGVATWWQPGGNLVATTFRSRGRPAVPKSSEPQSWPRAGRRALGVCQQERSARPRVRIRSLDRRWSSSTEAGSDPP